MSSPYATQQDVAFDHVKQRASQKPCFTGSRKDSRRKSGSFANNKKEKETRVQSGKEKKEKTTRYYYHIHTIHPLNQGSHQQSSSAHTEPKSTTLFCTARKCPMLRGHEVKWLGLAWQPMPVLLRSNIW